MPGGTNVSPTDSGTLRSDAWFTPTRSLVFLLPAVTYFIYVLIRWPDHFFADDSYFYFQVAWNLAHGQGSTFNGVLQTNGYHPLWMLCCTIVYLLVQSKETALHVIAATISLLNVATLAGVTLLLRRVSVSPAPAWLLLVPFLFTSQLGTEGALSGACAVASLLAAFRLAQEGTPTLAIRYSFLAVAAVLSRLDNIFFILTITASLLLILRRRSEKVMLLLALVPSATMFWGGYLLYNHYSFHTWQPMSGVLKTHVSLLQPRWSNLPHLALLDLASILVCLPVVWRQKRDLFFKLIEVPMCIGVLLHAMYIVVALSGETRWSWYYSSWTILAAILVSRALSALLADSLRVKKLLLVGCSALLVLLAYRNGRLRGSERFSKHNYRFETVVVSGAHLTTLFAFDKPGRIAYYSTARILPLDGLMADLQFQHDLVGVGVAGLQQRYGVDGLIGPPVPLNEEGRRRFCDHIYLGATLFHCLRTQEGSYQIGSVEVFSPLNGRSAGVIPLPASQLVWNSPGNVAVWRLEQPR